MGGQEPLMLWARFCALTFSWGKDRCCALELSVSLTGFYIFTDLEATSHRWTLDT